MIRFKPCAPLILCLFFVAMSLPVRAADHSYNSDATVTSATTWAAEESIEITAGGGDVTVTVQDVSLTGFLSTLDIIAGSSGNATLTFTSTSPSTTFSDVVTLAGNSSGGIATLEMENGAAVTASGGTEIGGNAVLDVSGSYISSGLLLAGNGAQAIVRAGGTLSVSGLTQITNGTLTVISGAAAAQFAGIALDGSNAVMNVAGDVTLTGGRTIALTSGGTLNVDGSATITGPITNTSGHFNVDSGVSLTVDGTVVSDAGQSGTVPTYGTTIDGSMTANAFTVGGGAALVDGTVNTDNFHMTGGQLDISGQMNGVTASGGFVVDGGTVNILAGGVVDTANIALSGSSILNVRGDVTDAAVDVAGGTVNVSDGGKLGTTAGALGGFSVSGSNTVVNIQGSGSELNTDRLSFSGGVINVASDGYLSADAVDAFAGTMNINGASAYFDNGFQIGGNGRIAVGAGGASIGVGSGATMTVGSGGSFDLSAGNASVSGNLTISSGGSYIAGFDRSASTVNLATVSGTATVANGASVRMSLDLQSHVNSVIDDLPTSPVVVLEASTVAAGQTLSWTSGSYEYIYGLDASGNLAVVNAIIIDEDTRYANLIELWNRDPSVNGHAADIIDRAFGKAITDGHAIRVGDQARYESYSRNGQANIDVLAGLAEATGITDGPTGYSGLMLYSGSGLNLANRAVLESTGSITRRVIRRNDAVRHELALAAASIDPDLAACMDNPANRLWVDGTYHRDHQSRDAGIPGYKYSPVGLTLGYDRVLGNQAVLGAAFAYAGGDFEDLAALGNDSSIDTYAALLYGSYNHCSGLYLSGALGYAYSDNDIRDYRALAGELGWNRAEYHNTTLMAALRLGIDIEPVEYLTITPSVGFSYQNSHGSAHDQFFQADNFGSSFNSLTVGKMKNHSASIPFELRVGYDLFADDDSLLNLSVLAGYAYETHDKGVSGSFGYGGLDDFGRFAPLGQGVGRHIMNFGIGAKYLYRQYEFSFDYDYYGRNGHGSHGFLGRFGVSF